MLLRYAAVTEWENVMRYFRHRRGRILFEVFAAFLVGSGAAAGWMTFPLVRLLAIAVAASLYGFWRGMTLLVRDPAIAYDENGVRIGRFFAVSTYKWNEVREVRAGRWRMDGALARRLPSWMPLEREYLEFMVPARALDFGWIKVRADLIQLPAGGLEELVALIRAAQVDAIGGRAAAMTRLGMSPGEQGKRSQPLTGLQAERFQRLGLPVEPEPAVDEASVDEPLAPQPVMPSRPVFGRKVS
jgi:hypothetical protein